MSRRSWLLILLWFAGLACKSPSGAGVVEAGRDAPGETTAVSDARDAGDVPIDEAPADVADAPVDRPDDAGRDGALDTSDTASDVGPRDDLLGTLGSFCVDKARHRCAALARTRQSFAPEDECRIAETARCVADAEGWQQQQWMRARIDFKPAAIEPCFAELDSPDWDPYVAVRFTACAKVWEGRALNHCLHDEECSSGGCAQVATCAPGTCVATTIGHSGLGSRCLGECEVGTYCRGPAGAAPCDLAGDTTACTCAARVVEGGACSAATMCQPGLGCVAGKCARAGRGDACDATIRCPDDLRCAAPTAGAATVCTDRLADGEVCTRRDCQSTSTCVRPLNEETGVCRPLPNLGDGCGYPLPSDCPNGAFCDVATLKCVARPRLGESCAGRTSTCYGRDLYCHPDTLRCEHVPRERELCTGTCTSGLYCDSEAHACRPGDKVAGALCGGSDQCASHQCKFASLTCGPHNCTGSCCEPFPELIGPFD